MNLQEKIAYYNLHHGEHSIDLYKRHIFAAFQDLSWGVVKSYKADYYVDALTLDKLPDKIADFQTTIIWYAWRDCGTHLWIQDSWDDGQMSAYHIRKYLDHDTHAIKIMLSTYKRLDYIQVIYAWIKGA